MRERDLNSCWNCGPCVSWYDEVLGCNYVEASLISSWLKFLSICCSDAESGVMLQQLDGWRRFVTCQCTNSMRVGFMVFLDKFPCVLEATDGLPSIALRSITLPSYQIEEFSSLSLWRENLLDLKFFMTFNINRWRWRCHLSRDLRFYIANKLACMEYWMIGSILKKKV